MPVLDAWALLAWIEGRPRALARVEEALQESDAVVSWINLGEVAYIVERSAGDVHATRVVMDIRVRARPVLPDEATVLAAARIKARHPMAYADAFACATAERIGMPLLTGDPEILGASDLGCEVEDLR